jgi:hypothetical protein
VVEPRNDDGHGLETERSKGDKFFGRTLSDIL